jgi:hypothetical protein
MHLAQEQQARVVQGPLRRRRSRRLGHQVHVGDHKFRRRLDKSLH